MKRRMTIQIVKTKTDVGPGYLCRANNGDLPFENRTFASKSNALDALDAAYKGKIWDGRITDEGYSILVD